MTKPWVKRICSRHYSLSLSVISSLSSKLGLRRKAATDSGWKDTLLSTHSCSCLGRCVLQLGLKLLYKYLVYFTPTSIPPGVLANAGEKEAEIDPLGITSGLRMSVLSPGKFTFWNFLLAQGEVRIKWCSTSNGAFDIQLTWFWTLSSALVLGYP